MKRYAITDDTGLVTNVVVWDGQDEYDPDGRARLLTETSRVSIGWTRDGNKWVEPVYPELNELGEPIPE